MESRNRFQGRICPSVPILELSIACGWGGRGGGRGREILGAKWTVRPTPRDLWLPHFLQILLSLPPPTELLHLSVRCLKNSMSRFKSFYFFSRKISIIWRFRTNVGNWSMFWFKSFRKIFRKIAIFRNFDHWSEILSMSAGRPLGQGVCPSLILNYCRKNPPNWACDRRLYEVKRRIWPLYCKDC